MTRITTLMIVLLLAVRSFAATLLREDTAVTINVGTAVDNIDGVTPETGLTAASVDEIGVYKHEATSLTDISGTTTLTHRGGGRYTATLSATDTGMPGPLTFVLRDDSVCLPIEESFMVVPANVYDSMIGGSDLLQTDATQLEGGDATDYFATAGPWVQESGTISGGTAGTVTISDVPANDYFNGQMLLLQDVSASNKPHVARITDSDGTAETISFSPGYATPASGDLYTIFRIPRELLDIRADTDVIGNPSTSLADDLASVKIDTVSILADTADIQPKLGTISDLGGGATIAENLADIETQTDAVQQKLPSKGYLTGTANSDGDLELGDVTGTMPSNSITAASLASDAIDADAVASNTIGSDEVATTAVTELQSGLSTFNAGADSVTVGALSQAGLADLFDTDSGTSYSSAIAGSVVKEVADNATTPSLTEGGIADEVLNELLEGHTTAGSLSQTVSDIFDFLDGAPTFADAMDGQGYTTARAEKIDQLAPSLLVSTTIDGTPASQTSLTLADGPPDDDALNGALIVVTGSDPSQKAVGVVKSYIASTKTVTLLFDPGVFTMAQGDQVDVIATGTALPLMLGTGN